MENFLSNFENKNTEVKSTNANLSVSPEFYGEIEILKGSLKMKIAFFARVYKSKLENCIHIDDWDINEKKDITFGGMPIDNLDKLKETMNNSGLTTMARGLEITDNEFKKEICVQLEQYKAFKEIFGKKARMAELLSNEERRKLHLEYFINNYEEFTISSTYIADFLIIDEDGNKSMPTVEQLKQML
jgi:hypothetical protein